MDIARLKEFVVLSLTRNFHLAAKELQITQPTLSYRIASLEKNLSVQLLMRNSHQVSLTEAGLRFFKDAQEIVNIDHSIRMRLKAIGEGIYRSLKIVMTGFSIVPLLGPFLDIFNERYPDIHLELLDDSEYNIANALSTGGVDLFFTYNPAPVFFPDLQQKRLLTTSLCVILPKDHQLAHKSQLALESLDGEIFIPWPKSKDLYMRNYQLELLEKSNINYHLYQDTTSPFFFFFLVPIGKGIVICPWVMRNMTPPNSVCIPLEGNAGNVSMYMYYRCGNTNPLLNEFLVSFDQWIESEEHST